jgi:hypothetical protein
MKGEINPGREAVMIRKPTTVHLSMMTKGIVAVFAALLLLPTPSARAAGNAQPVKRPMASRMAPAGAHASHAARVDPRIAEFNRELAAYKQTVASLRRDAQRLVAQQKRLNALIQGLNSGSEITMVKLQSLVQERTRIIQFATNVMKALNESEKNMVNNIRP